MLIREIEEHALRQFKRTQTCHCCNGRGTIEVVNGAALREAREAAGITLRDFAHKLGLSAAYISDVELGRRNLPLKRLVEFVRTLQGSST